MFGAQNEHSEGAGDRGRKMLFRFVIFVAALALLAGAAGPVSMPAAAEETTKKSAETEEKLPEDLLKASEERLKKSKGLLGTLLANYRACVKRGKSGKPCAEPFLERRASDKARDAIDYYTKAIRDQKASASFAAKLKDARARSKDKDADKDLAAEFAAKVPEFDEKTKTLRAKAEKFYRKGGVRYGEAMVRHEKFLAKNPGFSAKSTGN